MNKYLRYSIYGLLGLTLFVPLFVDNALFFPFITGKAFVFRTLVELAFFLWVILACKDKHARPRISPVSIGVTLFMIVAFIVDMTGFNPIRSIWSNFERMEGWVTIIHLWAYFIVLSSMLRTRKAWHAFLNTSLVAATIVALWGVGQALHLFPIHQSADRLDASLGNAEYLAVYMIFHAFISLYFASIEWTKRHYKGFFYLFLALLDFGVVYGTQTRGAILAVIGSCLVMLFIFVVAKDKHAHEKEREAMKKPRIIAAVLLVVIVLGSLGFYAVRNSHFIQSSPTLERIASISPANPRIEFIWPMAFKGFAEKPLLGWGQENFNYVFNDFYNPHMWDQEQWFDRAHNVFIDWLVAGGIVGFLFYTALYVLAFMMIWKSRFSIREKAVLTSLIIAYIIHNLFVFDNLASYMMFFIFLAFFDVSFQEAKEATPEKSKPVKMIGGHKTMNQEVADWIVAPVLVILFAVSVYFVNIRPYMANVDLIASLTECSGGTSAQPDTSYFNTALSINSYMANQEIREQIPGCAEGVINAQGVSADAKFAFYTLASTQVKEQTLVSPNDLRGFLFAGTFFNEIGQWDTARPYLERALALSPVKQSGLFAMATNDLNSNKLPDALALLKTAYTEAPEDTDSQTAYATALVLSGQYAAANALTVQYPSIATDPHYINAYMVAKQYPTVVTLDKQALVTDPNNVQLLLSLAGAYAFLHENALTVQTLNLIASSSPDYAPAVTQAEKDLSMGKNPFDTAQ